MSVHDDRQKPHVAEALRGARQIGRHFAGNGLRGGVTVFGGGGREPTAVACVFDFHGVSSSELAQKLIENLQDNGCGCTSSGEDDVQCTCPD